MFTKIIFERRGQKRSFCKIGSFIDNVWVIDESMVQLYGNKDSMAWVFLIKKGFLINKGFHNKFFKLVMKNNNCNFFDGYFNIVLFEKLWFEIFRLVKHEISSKHFETH